MTEEQIQQIAQLILAEWEFSGPEPGKCMLEGWSPEKVWRASTPFGQRAATGIARKIAPLVEAAQEFPEHLDRCESEASVMPGHVCTCRENKLHKALKPWVENKP